MNDALLYEVDILKDFCTNVLLKAGVRASEAELKLKGRCGGCN